MLGGMAKKHKTRAEKDYHNLVASVGCIIPDCNEAANVHHIRAEQGIAMRSSHYLVIPLCKEHHQGSFSIHNSKRQFEAIYGSELNLLAETICKLRRK